MRRVRQWLAAPDKLTDRQADLLVAGCYLAGHVLKMLWDWQQERRTERLMIDREFRRITEEFKRGIDRVRSEVPRPDAEKGGPT